VFHLCFSVPYLTGKQKAPEGDRAKRTFNWQPIGNYWFYSNRKRKIMREKQLYIVVCQKQSDKYDLEKLCEKKKWLSFSMMPLYRRIERKIVKIYVREKRKIF
jgi:hypothetical protein